jgi:hypothetical protein
VEAEAPTGNRTQKHRLPEVLRPTTQTYRANAHHAARKPGIRPQRKCRNGESGSDLDGVRAFLRSGGLTIDETHAPGRTVLATGTAAQLSDLFSVTLGRYEASLPPTGRRQADPPGTQTYRSYEGPIHVPVAVSVVAQARLRPERGNEK